MSDLVTNREILVDFLGYFPSFHDDEILSVQFDYLGPKILMEIYTRQWTNKLDERRYLRFGNTGIVTIRFDGVSEMQFEGEYLRQNVISEMWFTQHEKGILTEFDAALGIYGKIMSECVTIESVVPARLGK